MKSTLLKLICVVAVLTIAAPAHPGGTPVGSSFTYQGELKNNGTPVNGVYDFDFWLSADDQGGEILDTNHLNGVNVVNGRFTVELNFGSEVFNGQALWVSVLVRDASNPDPTMWVLWPPQPIKPAPYAIRSLNPGPAGPSGPEDPLDQ